VENCISDITVKTLRVLGNKVNVKVDYDLYFGGAQGIMAINGVM